MSDRPSAGLPNNRFPTGTVPHNGPGRRDKRVTAKFDKSKYSSVFIVIIYYVFFHSFLSTAGNNKIKYLETIYQCGLYNTHIIVMVEVHDII